MRVVVPPGADTWSPLVLAVAEYQAAEVKVATAEEARGAAYRSHVATIPVVGRVRLGAGDDRTRRAHHAACQRVVSTQIVRDRLARAVVAAAVDHVARCVPWVTSPGSDAAHSVSGSDPADVEATG